MNTFRHLAFLPTVTGTTGGGPTKLDGVHTIWVLVPRLYILVLDGSSQRWILQAGTLAEDAANGVVRPDDFDPLTNAKVFVQG